MNELLDKRISRTQRLKIKRIPEVNNDIKNKINEITSYNRKLIIANRFLKDNEEIQKNIEILIKNNLKRKDLEKLLYKN